MAVVICAAEETKYSVAESRPLMIIETTKTIFAAPQSRFDKLNITMGPAFYKNLLSNCGLSAIRAEFDDERIRRPIDLHADSRRAKIRVFDRRMPCRLVMLYFTRGYSNSMETWHSSVVAVVARQ